MAETAQTGIGLDLCYAATSVRGKRDRLQDNYFCSRELIARAGSATGWAETGALTPPEAPSQAKAIPELLDFPVAPELTGVRLFALADGVGGHNRGDLAAAEAVRLLTLFYQPDRLRSELEADIFRHGLAAKSPLEGLESWTSAERIVGLLRAAYQRINTALHFHEVPDIRTTLVTLALEQSRLYLANVGDSRVYRFGRDAAGNLRAPERLTVDDSYLDRKIYEGEFLPFAPCSYEVASELRQHLEQEGRYSLEFIFDLSRLDKADAELPFEERCRLAHEEIGRILSDGTARLYRRATQLGTIAPAQQIKEEGLLRALGHQEWLEEISSTVRQGRRRARSSAAEPLWLELGEGELLLLCSDGLTDGLAESRIHQFLVQKLGVAPAVGSEELASVCQELVALAEREESCVDNISAVLVQTPVSRQRLAEAEVARASRVAAEPAKPESDTGRLSRAAIQRRAEPARPVASAAVARTERVDPLPALDVSAPLERAPLEAPRSVLEAPRASSDPEGQPDRSASRLVQALVEKKTMDREMMSLLKRLEDRLTDTDDKLEEVRASLSELRGRLNGLARRGEMLERMGSLPFYAVAIVLLLLVLVVLQFTR